MSVILHFYTYRTGKIKHSQLFILKIMLKLNLSRFGNALSSEA